MGGIPELLGRYHTMISVFSMHHEEKNLTSVDGELSNPERKIISQQDVYIMLIYLPIWYKCCVCAPNAHLPVSELCMSIS